MKKICLFLFTCLLISVDVFGITARQVLDKTSAVLSNKGGVSAHFTMNSGKYGTTSGNIAVKGRKFHATTPLATIWFDGRTQWTFMKRNNEVNVSNPGEGDLQAINPYNFINMYRRGYTLSMKTVGRSYQVHLKATDRRRQVQEMYITVSKSSYVPSQVKMRQGNRWSTINISGFKRSNLSDGLFRFNSREFPSAEVIDLR